MSSIMIQLDSNRTVTGSISTGVHMRADDKAAPLVSVSVATVTGTAPNLTPKLMHSVDGANYDVLATGPSITASGGKAIFGPDTTKPVGRYLRVDYDVTGTTPSFSGLDCELQLG